MDLRGLDNLQLKTQIMLPLVVRRPADCSGFMCPDFEIYCMSLIFASTPIQCRYILNNDIKQHNNNKKVLRCHYVELPLELLSITTHTNTTELIRALKWPLHIYSIFRPCLIEGACVMM